MYTNVATVSQYVEGCNVMHSSRGAPQVTKQSLDALLQDVGQNKSKESFMTLYDYFAPRVKSYLLKGGLNEDEADELAQETMLMVWQKAASYDADLAAASTWIFTVARNKRTDYYRKSGRIMSVPPEKFYDLTSDEDSPFEAFYEQEVNADIGEALKALSSEQIEIIKKAYFEDKAHSQIAEETGLPLGTVKSRIRLAMDKLKHALDKSGHKDSHITHGETKG